MTPQSSTTAEPATVDATVTSTTLGERARAMRLRPRAAQDVFKVLLGTLARPGTIGALAVPSGVPPALLPALALADVETPATVLEELDEPVHQEGPASGEVDPGWGEPLIATTGARRSAVSAAEIVVALRPATPGEVLSLQRGTAFAPEQGARLVLAVDGLHESAGPLRLVLSGPGVRNERTVAVTGLDPAVLSAVREANADYPAGIDLHLVAADGALVSVPRSATVRIESSPDNGAATQGNEAEGGR
jgi:alpha-D-ribose 1-methylphosphonate 5-triphosphate synthase subunit PhnH